MKKALTVLALACAPLLSLAQALQVENAWIRPTVAGQQGTGGFMTLKSKIGVTVTGVSVDAAIGAAELHEMAMVGDIMRMRAVEKLNVPAGKALELKPGGYHLMLVGLKSPLAKGSQVPVTFTYKDAKGVAGKVDVKIPVEIASPHKASMSHDHKH
jgi:periplasmic copper chaperone A